MPTSQKPKLRQPKPHNQDPRFLRIAQKVNTGAKAAGLPEGKESPGSFSWGGKVGSRYATLKILILPFWGPSNIGLGVRQDLVVNSPHQALRDLPWGEPFVQVGCHGAGFLEFPLAEEEHMIPAQVEKLLKLVLTSNPNDERRAEFRRQFDAITV